MTDPIVDAVVDRLYNQPDTPAEQLANAPDILRGIADYLDDPLADLPDYVLGLDPDDLRRWADAIEQL